MNTYTITANVSMRKLYLVDAHTEEEAMSKVEWGEVDEIDTDLQSIEDLEVTDVEYGETEYTAEVSLSFYVRGNIGDQPCDEAAGNALGALLATYEGRTGHFGEDGEIELTNFDVVDLESM